MTAMNTPSTQTLHDFGDGAGPVPAHRHSNGGGWVADTASVADTAYVGPDAKVSGDARVFGHAQLFDNTWVFENVRVSGNVKVFGNALVFGNAWVFGNAVVKAFGKVSGNAVVEDVMKYHGITALGAPEVSEQVHIYGCDIEGNALVSGNDI